MSTDKHFNKPADDVVRSLLTIGRDPLQIIDNICTKFAHVSQN